MLGFAEAGEGLPKKLVAPDAVEAFGKLNGLLVAGAIAS
jgi:hypothetical protein